MPIITPHPSVELLEERLEQRHYAIEHFEMDGSSFSRFIAPSGKSWLTEATHVSYPFTSRTINKISTDKHVAYAFCERLGVRIPYTTYIGPDYPEQDLELLLEHHSPLAIKPYNASLSWGLSLNVTTIDNLRAAVDIARQVSHGVLVQEQVDGEEIRFVVMDGKVTAAILREMPRLTGDGISSLAELLEIENAARRQLRMPYVTYPELSADLLRSSDYDMADVLGDGELVLLSRSTMIKTGASIYNVLDSVHASYRVTAEKLAVGLGARFMIVDMMLHDYTEPQTDTNYAFIEFNSAPVLKLFYSCRDGRHYDILNDLVPMIDATLQ